MANAHRKELLEEFKNRKTARGIFAVRCSSTAQVWVGSAPNLEARKNGLWFTLRQGGNNNPTLQSAWAEHGEGNFSYEAVEILDDDLFQKDRLGNDLSPMALRDTLKDRLSYWAKELQAHKLLA